MERRMAAQIRVSKALAESESLREVSPQILGEISAALGFEIGILWRVFEGEMVCEEAWQTPDAQAEQFIEKTKSVKLPPGKGLPGKAWVARNPVWVDQVTPNDLSVPPSAIKAKIQSAGCVPIILKNEVLGAMEFASRSKQLPDAKIEELMLAMASQVGLFIERNRKLEALRQCEDRYRVLANTEPNVLVTIDEEFRITFVNKSIERTFGYSQAEVVGKNLLLLIPEYHDHKHALKQVVKSMIPMPVELPGVHKNGTMLTLEVAFSPFSGTETVYSKAQKYATGVLADISDRLRIQAALRETELKLQRVLSNSPSSIVIAEAPAMRGLIERVKKAAISYASILIQGETGSGKECIAHMIHHQSPLAAKPFVARNCAAIPANLFESEMFGHKKGSFTGADKDRKGAFLEADGGTLFLDEIGDLEYVLQTKLLRAIQEKVILPVGGDKEIPVNPRIICATNKDLLECSKEKKFREDLYYRLVTVLLNVPPLRNRQEDIIPLARHFIGIASGWTRTLSPDAEQRLLTYPWPGNVRELRSLMDQSVIFSAGNEIQPEELLFSVGSSDQGPNSKTLVELERRHILQVIKECKGNKTEAAKVLGLARSTLVIKLKSYNVDAEGEKDSE